RASSDPNPSPVTVQLRGHFQVSSSFLGDSENATRKAIFSLGVANGLESDTYQSSW
ncbi:hypothetical protein M9458_003836, partial [Cirrhinus mrigala]